LKNKQFHNIGPDGWSKLLFGNGAAFAKVVISRLPVILGCKSCDMANGIYSMLGAVANNQ
jgi:hypothetical protein